MSFFSKNKERMMVTAVAIILIVLIGVTSAERLGLSKFEKAIGSILTPIGRMFNSAGKPFADFFSNIKDIANLKDENESLKAQVALLEEQNRNNLNIIGKFDYLRKEVKLLEDTKFDLVESHVVGKESGKWFHRFTINKGSKDNIKKYDTVIQGVEIEQGVVIEGVIGRVIDVGPNFAKIVTIVDELNSIAFKAIRTQDGGIISGSIDGEISGFLFDNKADIIKGDKLFTSGLGGVYKDEIYIGDVEEVISDDEDLMKKIIVNPAIDFKKLYKVYVISN